MSTLAPDLDPLFMNYLDVVNRALTRTGRDFPYDRLLDLAERALGARDVWVTVVEEGRPEPVAWYAVRLQGDRFVRVDHGSVSPNDRAQWRVTLDHLEAVAREPNAYVDQPDRLELDWLKRRVGMG